MTKKKLIFWLLMLPAIFILFVGIVFGILFVKGWIRESRENQLTTDSQEAINELIIDCSDESKSFAQLFPVDASIGFLIDSHKDGYVSILTEEFRTPEGLGCSISKLTTDVEKVIFPLIKKDTEPYLNEARQFWLGISDVSVDSCEVFQELDDQKLIYKVGISFSHPSRTDADIFITGDWKVIFPFSGSLYFYAAYKALVENNVSTPRIPGLLLIETLLMEAEFGFPDAKKLNELGTLVKNGDITAESSIDWLSFYKGILDTVYDESSIQALRALTEALKEAKLLDRGTQNSVFSEIGAIEKYVQGEYEEAIQRFWANRSAGFPGTYYYISTCSEIIGRKDSTGANMREIIENLR